MAKNSKSTKVLNATKKYQKAIKEIKAKKEYKISVLDMSPELGYELSYAIRQAKQSLVMCIWELEENLAETKNREQRKYLKERIQEIKGTIAECDYVRETIDNQYQEYIESVFAEEIY